MEHHPALGQPRLGLMRGSSTYFIATHADARMGSESRMAGCTQPSVLPTGTTHRLAMRDSVGPAPSMLAPTTYPACPVGSGLARTFGRQRPRIPLRNQAYKTGRGPNEAPRGWEENRGDECRSVARGVGARRPRLARIGTSRSCVRHLPDKALETQPPVTRIDVANCDVAGVSSSELAPPEVGSDSARG